MKYRYAALVSLFVAAFSCNTQQAHPPATEKAATKQETAAPPQVVSIAGLTACNPNHQTNWYGNKTGTIAEL